MDLDTEKRARQDLLAARRDQSSPDPQFVSAFHLRTILAVANVHQPFAYLPAAISAARPVRNGGEIQKWIR